MTYPNIFTPEVSNQMIARIDSLNNETKALWGKMNVSQMLAHCSVTYEMIFTDKHKKPGFMLRLILKMLVKPTVVGTKPYKKSSQTAPAFIIADERDFEVEKGKLVAYIRQVQELGADHFDGKESLSFGKLTKDEWNSMFYKHLDYHVGQFGA